MPDERNKAHIGQVLAPELVFRNPRDTDQLLDSGIASDRDHQSAANLELIFERVGHPWTTGSDDDAVVGGMIRPTLGAIAMQNVHVVVAEIGQQRSRLFGELPDPLDGVNVAGHLGQNCCRVA